MIYRNKIAKTVINPVDEKRPMEIIINSGYRKKNKEEFINYVYEGKTLLLNIYKLVQAGSTKCDSLE
ncbi:hypothetical protein YYC_00082 [Plasmodium yoelii 17X]|uniref:Uncharacterized protein n=1 Tax=Plasmodium yoelii 17X TaxID=1323249 RepID=V7PYJ6_PLAYE|nr:hypothetical protein YYC_00082 [Plasmodium yoelii 17X]